MRIQRTFGNEKETGVRLEIVVGVKRF